jgi:hypothetical protein
MSGNKFADYINVRIRRRPKMDWPIVRGSTPVIAFGDASTANVATLGLNPSRVEFLNDDGTERIGAQRRLATMRSLELSTTDLTDAAAHVVEQIVSDCNSYFRVNPYWDWFGKLSPILKACGASYQDGSACHLDLVQWATDPTWGKLQTAELCRQLIEEDIHFFLDHLAGSGVRLLLVNGSAVWRALRQKELRTRVNMEWQEQPQIKGLRFQSTRLFSGTLCERISVIAWSTNLQSSWGVSDAFVMELARRVGEIASDL